MENYYVNGRLEEYGTDWLDGTPHKCLALNDDGLTLNLHDGDLFKVAQSEWTRPFGMDKLVAPRFGFKGEKDGFGGQNIRCNRDGRYHLYFQAFELHAEFLGEITEAADSVWQLATSINDWGKTNAQRILLRLTDVTNTGIAKISPEIAKFFNFYSHSDPIKLDFLDEVKVACILDNGRWFRSAGFAQLLLPIGDQADVADFEAGKNVGGENISVRIPGDYRFYLGLRKNAPEQMIVMWEKF